MHVAKMITETAAADRASLDAGSCRLVEALQNPALYDHPVDGFSVIETHISWVILTGRFAYKMKKPVNFGFLDFSSLEKRQYYCHEELRLNRRFAPELYLAVVTVSGRPDQPRLDDEGEAIEYLVNPQSELLDKLAASGRLSTEHVDAIASLVAAIHARADPADPGTRYGSAKIIHHWMEENFAQIFPLLHDRDRAACIDALQDWSHLEHDHCRPLMEKRKKDGFIRECHGDLHLGNMAIIDEQVTAFDCIEFNPALRYIDVISEAAFVMMDLLDRGLPDYAWQFINHYLQQTGDYPGVGLLRYYLVYRALVRAKVAALQLQQKQAPEQTAGDAWQTFNGYAELAWNLSQDQRPDLIIMHGLSGSGKSTLARRLAREYGGFQLRSDVERKRLYGLEAASKSGSGLDTGIYTADATTQTYLRLLTLASHIIEAGYPAIVDASFLDRDWRSKFRHLAGTLKHRRSGQQTLTAHLRHRFDNAGPFTVGKHPHLPTVRPPTLYRPAGKPLAALVNLV